MPSSFYNYLNGNANVRLTCPKCTDIVTLFEFYKHHAQDRHDANPRLKCVFCFGVYGWPKGTKRSNRNHEKHMASCLSRFLNANRFRETSPDISCERFRSIPGEMHGRVKDRLSEYVGFYSSVFEKPDMWTGDGGVKFNERSGLGHDVYWMVRRYLDGDLDWYHLMVKHGAFETFVREMTPVSEKFVVLPFWCLCDGLQNDLGQKTSHRHMIVACEKGCDGGRSVFSRVLSDKVRIPNVDAKFCRPIRDQFHLLETITYVSGTKAQCDRGIPEGEGLEKRHSHFCVNRPIPKHGRAFLFTLVQGGIEWLVKSTLRNKSVIDWAEHAVKGRNWRVPVGKTGWPYLNCVIPVDKQYEPTTDRSQSVFYVHLYNELHFRENLDLIDLPSVEWNSRQVRLGNTLRSVEAEAYTMSRKQQYAMNQIKAMEDRTRCWWESKYLKVQRELDALRTKCKAVENQLNAVQIERDELRMERDTYKTELDAGRVKLAELEKEHLTLQEKLKWRD